MNRAVRIRIILRAISALAAAAALPLASPARAGDGAPAQLVSPVAPISAELRFSDKLDVLSEGDPFHRGRWVSASGGRGFVERRFDRPRIIRRIALNTALYGPAGTEGSINVILFHADGSRWEARKFVNQQAARSPAPSQRDQYLPPQTLDLNPGVDALGVRLEFEGRGPFILEDARLDGPEAEATASTDAPPLDGAIAPPPAPPVSASAPDKAAGIWRLISPEGVQQQATLALKFDGGRLSGRWDFYGVAGGPVTATWNEGVFQGSAEMDPLESMQVRFALSMDGQRLSGKAWRAGLGDFDFHFVRLPQDNALDANDAITDYMAEWAVLRYGNLMPGVEIPDFSGDWVESAAADDIDLRFLRLTQQNSRVTGAFHTLTGVNEARGYVRNGRLYLVGGGFSGRRSAWILELGPDANRLTGTTRQFDGLLPRRPATPLALERSPLEVRAHADHGHAADIQ